MSIDPNQSILNESNTLLPAPMEVIPHRPPMLFLHTVESCQQNSIIGHYRFQSNDPIFRGHFPERPIVPGVLLLEGAAQTLAYWALRQYPDHLVLLTGTEKAKWSHPVYPEEPIDYFVTVLKAKLGLVIADATVQVGGKTVLTAQIKGFLRTASSMTLEKTQQERSLAGDS